MNSKKSVIKNKSTKPRSEKQIAVQFKPGKSGNPHGRPVIPAEVKQRILELTPDAVDFLVSIIKSPRQKASLRKWATEQILDRGLGKPKQEVELSGSVEIPIILDPILSKEFDDGKTDK